MSSNCLQNYVERSEKVLSRANESRELLVNILREYYQSFAEQDSEYNDAENALDSALKTLVEKLEKPVLRIAAIGTTSSAKSSLLNLFAGERLLPVGVQEKSAGVTRIINDEQVRLKIEETENSQWNCGEFEVADADEIREVLDAVMEKWRSCIKSGMEIEAPSFIIHYPLPLVNALDLPEGCQLELMDLPGLRYTGDARNRKVIQNCRDALCIVTYSSLETDPEKQNILLDDVLEQIKAINAPISRMLFTATCIDAFLLQAGEDWPENEKEFLKERKQAILDRLIQAFPNQKIKGIEMTTISPNPALYTWELTIPERRWEAYKKIKKSYEGLVTGGLDGDAEKGIDVDIDLSSPKYREWTESDWEMIVEQLQKTTRFDSFFTSLSGRISSNFADIILPVACADFIDSSKNQLERLKADLEFSENALLKNYEEQIQILQNAAYKLEEINNLAASQLKDFTARFTEIVFDSSIRDRTQKMEALKKDFPFLYTEQLKKMLDWNTAIRTAFLKPAHACCELLISGTALPKSLPGHVMLAIECAELRRNGYKNDSAKYGFNRMVAEKQDGSKYNQLYQNFNALVKKVEKSAQKNMEFEIICQTEYLLDLLTSVQDAYLAGLEYHYRKTLPAELKEVTSVTPGGLKRYVANIPLDPVHLQLKGKSEIKSTIKQVTVEAEPFDSGIPPLDSIVQWWREIRGTDKIIKWVNDIKRHIIIPPAGTIVSELSGEYDKKIPDLQKGMTEFVHGQMDIFLKNITDYQNTRLKAYGDRLSSVMIQKQRDIDEKISKLEDLRVRSDDAMNKLTSISEIYQGIE